MTKFLLALAIGGALLTGCSKHKDPPGTGTNPERISKSISFSIYADATRTDRDPEKTSASIRLTVAVSSLSNIQTNVVWDTTIATRTLREFPGPKEPLVFTRIIELNNSNHNIVSLTCNKIYQLNHKVETVDHTEAMLPSSKVKTMDVAL
jgi:hypothetical protein